MKNKAERAIRIIWKRGEEDNIDQKREKALPRLTKKKPET